MSSNPNMLVSQQTLDTLRGRDGGADGGGRGGGGGLERAARDRQRQQLVDRWAGVRAPDVETREARLRRERLEREQRPGAFEAIGHAASSEWMGAWAMRRLRRRGYEFDPDFVPFEPETFEQLTDGLPPELWEEFAEAQSMPHALRIREQLMQVRESRDKLQRLGWTGTGLRMGALVLDPAAITIGLGGAKIGGPAVYGGNLTRMQRLVRGGLIAAGSETAIEGYLSMEDPERSVRDVMAAGAGGFLLGGTINLALGGRMESAATKLKRDVEFQETAEAALREGLIPPDTPAGQLRQAVAANVLTDKGRAYFRQQLSPEHEREFIDNLILASGLDPDADATLIAELRAMQPAEAATFFGDPSPAGMPGGGAGGGARAASAGVDAEQASTVAAGERTSTGPAPAEWGRTPKANRRAGDLDLSGTSSARAAFTRARRSFASILGMSDSEQARLAASAYADDRLLKVDGSGGTPSASAWVTRQVQSFQARYYRLALREFNDWRRRHRVSASVTDKHKDQFFRDVGEAIRRPRGQYTNDPAVNRVADLQRDLQRELLELGQRHGVKGFGRVAANDQYLMRMHKHGVLDQMVSRYGEDAVVRLYAGAIRAASEDLGEAAATTIARGFTRSIRKMGDRTELDKARIFQSDEPEALAQLLRENVPDITDAQVEDIVFAVTPRQREAGVHPRAMRRLGLDETYSAQMPDGSWLSIGDLVETNAETIFNLYARQVVGASASAEVYRVMRRSADDVIETFDQLRNRLDADMRAAGVDEATRARDLDLLETLDKHVRGIPLTKNTTTARALRLMRGAAHVLMSGQFGVAQLGEFGNIVAEMTTRAMLQQMPAVARVARRARDGRLPNELLEELEHLTALGTERVSGQVYSRFDASGAMVEWGGGAVERTLRKGQRLSNDLSLMAPINSGLQRLAGAAAAQRITNAAFTGRPMSARRLQALGLGEDDAARIYEQIRTHASTEQGMLGRRLRRINIDAWADQEAASKLVHALDRWSRRAIQTSDIGAMHPFMTGDFGRMLFQFRNFVVQAWEAQFLHRVQMRDFQAFTSAAYVAFTAGLAYVGQQYAMSIGRPNQDEFLRERLSTDAITRATVQRAAWSTLWPGIVDTTGYMLGADPIFTARHTGMDTDFFFGSPATSIPADLARGVRGTTGTLIQGDDYTRADAAAWSRLAPLRRVFGISNVVESFPQRFDD